MTVEEAQRAVHEALSGFLDDDEITINWVLTIDIAGPDNRRYLAHRAGGGADGTEGPAAWHALGMLQCASDVARDQLRGMTEEPPEDEE
jgi:hypothetical protein